ncbi:NUDIX hydrolase [soil metagenome]
MPHIHEKIDYTVEVFIVFQNKVLLRRHDKYGIWLSVGGHIELNEDPNEAALREVKEEVGLDIRLDNSLLPPTKATDTAQDLIPPFFLGRHRINETHEHITFIYFATSNTDHLNLSTTEKSADVHWFNKEKLENTADIIPDVRFYALQALSKLSS